MNRPREQYSQTRFLFDLRSIGCEMNTYVKFVRLVIMVVVLIFCQMLHAQKINIDSFYNEVSHIDDLEGKRKKFYELRIEFRYSEKMDREEWMGEIVRLFDDERYSDIQYQLIKGDLHSGAFEDLGDYLAAAKENISCAKLYLKSGLGHPGNVAIHYSTAGKDFLRNGQLDSAAYYLDQAHEINIENNLNIWDINIQRADLFKELRNWEKVDQCYKEGYDMLVARNRPSKLGYYLYQSCTYYYQSGRNPELLNFFMSELDEYQAGKPLSTAASHYPLLDFLYAPPIDTTIERLSTALKFNRSRNNIHGTNILSRSLANAYSRKNEYYKSIQIIKAELGAKTDTIDSYYGYLLYDDLQKYYNAVGNESEAYKSILVSQKYRDRFINQRMKESTADAQVKYETERTEKELIKKEAELSLANQRLMLFGAGGIGLLGMLGLVYRNMQFRKKTNKELELKNRIISNALKEKDDLLREIHHRVKNNLQIISSLLSLQSRNSTDADTKAAIQEGRDRVRSMALIHQNLYVDKDKVSVKVEEYIPKLVDDLSKGLTPCNLNLQIKVNVEPMQMDIDTIVPIGLIINELVTNALKYAFVGRKDGELSVEAGDSDKAYRILIQDNGVGFDPNDDAKGSGLGRQLITSFCEKLNADLVTESIRGEGTKVEIYIPHNT